MDMPRLSIAPMAPEGVSVLGARSLRRSPTSWKLASPHADDDTLSVTDSEEDGDDSTVARKRARSIWMQKPPRHNSMPSCVLSVLELWKRVLQRDDISVMSELFYDLEGTEEHAWLLVEQMQCMGVSISIQQFLSLRRCCVYHVILTAL